MISRVEPIKEPSKDFPYKGLQKEAKDLYDIQKVDKYYGTEEKTRMSFLGYEIY